MQLDSTNKTFIPVVETAKSDNATTTKSRKLAANGKASDDDEGIPGYLTDPNRVNTRTDFSGNRRIIAPANTIITEAGKVVYINTWQIPQEMVDISNGILVDDGAASATLLNSSLAEADGSLDVNITGIERNATLVFTFSYEEEPEDLSFVVAERNTYAALVLNGSNTRPQGGGPPPPGGGQQRNSIDGLVSSDLMMLAAFDIDFELNVLEQMFD